MPPYVHISFVVSVSSCSSYIEAGKSLNKYVKYTPDDLERMLNELFEGKSRQPRQPGQPGQPGTVVR